MDKENINDKIITEYEKHCEVPKGMIEHKSEEMPTVDKHEVTNRPL